MLANGHDSTKIQNFQWILDQQDSLYILKTHKLVENYQSLGLYFEGNEGLIRWFKLLAIFNGI